MVWETIATICAGLGAAGVGLLLRLLWRTMPKMWIPMLAGAGMLGFQIVREYSWYGEQVTRLPEGVAVVATLDGKTWYRPWHFIKAPVWQFAVVERGSRAGYGVLYVLSRYQPTQAQRVSVDCNAKQSALPNTPPEQRERMIQALCG